MLRSHKFLCWIFSAVCGISVGSLSGNSNFNSYPVYFLTDDAGDVENYVMSQSTPFICRQLKKLWTNFDKTLDNSL